ncbi:hypothetical protein JCM11641_005216 [Rhodosporidiobolus odoratus]
MNTYNDNGDSDRELDATALAVASKSAGLESTSWRSEHSLRTIRGNQTPKSGGRDSFNSSDEEAGHSGVTLDGITIPGLEGRRVGPQFVIDLDPSSSDSPTTSSMTRPRSSTFGGVELPPSPLPSSSVTNSNSLPLPASTRPALSRQRSTSLSSLSSLSPDLHLGGAPFRERRPVLYAGLQAGALLLVCVVGMWLLLKGLLPPIDEEHRGKVKLPKSFEELKGLNEVLQVYRERNYWRVMGCYVVVYLFLQAFSVPGSMYLSILGGALFGGLVSLVVVCTCVATGASICYYLSRFLGPAVLQHSEVWQRRIEAWTERISKHRGDLISYLIILRIAPLPPHWVLNVVAPHLGIGIRPFWIATFVGIAGVSYIHTQIGTTLDQMTSSEDFHLISWKNGLGLGGIILAVSIPLLLKKYYASDLTSATAEPGGLEPSEPLLHPRASLSLDTDDEHHGGRGQSSSDGSARIGLGGSAAGGPGELYRDEINEEDVGQGRRPVVRPGAGSADKVSRVLGVQVGRGGGGGE